MSQGLNNKINVDENLLPNNKNIYFKIQISFKHTATILMDNIHIHLVSVEGQNVEIFAIIDVSQISLFRELVRSGAGAAGKLSWRKYNIYLLSR